MSNASATTTKMHGGGKSTTTIEAPAGPSNKLRAKRGPVFHESRSRIRGHNFAIRLLQTLESRIHLMVEDFCVGEGIRKQHSTLDRTSFVHVMLAHVRAGPKDPDETCWLADINDEEMMEKIGDVFDAADFSGKGRISFSTLMGYVIDCARYGEVGTVQEAIPEYVGTQGTFFRSLEDITKAKYCPELGRILCSGKSVGVVQTQTLHVKAFTPYPHMTTAAEKFATTYDLDYVPHMESIAFVGTDRFVDFFHAESGERVMRIPTPQIYSVCSFDRSTKLLLTARDSVVDTMALREFRHTDQSYQVGRSMQLHTDTIHCVRPLQRGGLMATASSDKTVVISDLEVGETITTFRAHQHAVHSVEYIDHLNLMMSCGFDTEPKVWMLASSAMRSEAFTLRDVENPHTGVVVDACSIVDTPQVCTLDSHGTVKLWDIRMFRAQQSIRMEKTMDGIFDAKALKWHSVVWDPVAQELFACAQRRAQKLRRKVMLREETADTATSSSPTKGSRAASPGSPEKKDVQAAQSKSASMADESHIVCVSYESVSQTIATLSEKKIRIWDLFTGHQEAIFDKLVPYDTAATCMCLSSTGKVFFLGLRNGRLTSHQYSSGSLLATYVEDGPEIAQLTYCADAQSFCAVTWRGARLFADRHGDLTSFFPDSMRAAEVKSSAFDSLTNILCTVERKGNLSLWESRSGAFTATSVKLCGFISVGHLEITCAMVLPGYPVVAFSTHVGGLQLYTCTPHPVPNRKFAEGLFKGREITCLQFYPPKNILYCGDDKGWIHAFDISYALETVNCRSPSSSWSQLMSTVGRLGCASKDVDLLKTVYHVHAHMETIGALHWPIGCNLLVSSSTDQRVLIWSLGLEFIGELDPLSEGGRFRVPMAAPPVDHAHLVTAAPGESIPFSSTHPESDAFESPSMTDSYGSGAYASATFAEDVQRLTMELESFVPSSSPVRRREKDVVKELSVLGTETSAQSKAYGKRAAVGRSSGWPARHGSSTSGRSLLDPGVDEELVMYSANSSGVACHSLFSPSPERSSFQSKNIVVEQCTPAESVANGCAAFTVTRNHPLPPNTRRDRDWLIRELQLQEEASLANVAEGPTTDREGPSEQHAIKESPAGTRSSVAGRNSVSTLRAQAREVSVVAPTSSDMNQLANESFISQIDVTKDVPPAFEHSGGHIGAFFSSPSGFEALPTSDMAPFAAKQTNALPPTQAMYRSLLPYELLQLRNEISKQEKRSRMEVRRAASNHATPHERSSQHASRHQRHLPPASRQATSHAVGRPHSQLWEHHEIDWSQSAPRSVSAALVEGSRGGTGTRPSRTMFSQAASASFGTNAATMEMTATRFPQQTNPTQRRPFTLDEVPSVGFCTFGVRSLAPVLAPVLGEAARQNGSVWAKTHRVDMVDPRLTLTHVSSIRGRRPSSFGAYDAAMTRSERISEEEASVGPASPALGVPSIRGFPGMRGEKPPLPNSRPPTVPSSTGNQYFDL